MNSLLIFMVTCLFMSALPGPNNVLAMTHSMRSGYKQALIGILGRFPAFAILVLIAAFLFNSAIVINQGLFRIIQVTGCLYMVYIGMQLIRHRYKKIIFDKDDNIRHYVRIEFLTALSNPKAIIVFTGFFPNFISLDHFIIEQFIFLGLLALAAEAIMALFYVAIGSFIKIKNISFSRIYLCSGIFIICIALRIFYGIL